MGESKYIQESIKAGMENLSSIEKENPIDKSFSIRESSLNEIAEPEQLISKIFLQRNFILNENWSKTFLLSARILKATPDFIHCECIISKENKLTQIREFPKLLFSHISPLIEGKFIKIKISQKPGSTRTDIIDGKDLGIEDEFKVFDSWKELKDYPTDKPF